MNILSLHEKVWKQLVERRQQLPHALLLTGQRGIGKFDLAVHFVQWLLCENSTSSQEACGTCLSCGWLSQGNHPDFRLIQPETLAGIQEETTENSSNKKASQQITIDQIRALDDFLHIGTHRMGLRIVLINPAEAMNRSTANSLLKSLEEPSVSTLFILVSSEYDRLLPTIRSRCQQLFVPIPEFGRSTACLNTVGIKDAEHWLALTGSSPLRAAELASTDEHLVLDILVAELTKGAGLNPFAAAVAIDRTIKAVKVSIPLKQWVEWGQKWLIDLILVRIGQNPRYFLTYEETLHELVKTTNLEKLLAFFRKALQYRRQTEQPLNSRLFFEDFFLGYMTLFQPVKDGNA